MQCYCFIFTVSCCIIVWYVIVTRSIFTVWQLLTIHSRHRETLVRSHQPELSTGALLRFHRMSGGHGHKLTTCFRYRFDRFFCLLFLGRSLFCRFFRRFFFRRLFVRRFLFRRFFFRRLLFRRFFLDRFTVGRVLFGHFFPGSLFFLDQFLLHRFFRDCLFVLYLIQ